MLTDKIIAAHTKRVKRRVRNLVNDGQLKKEQHKQALRYALTTLSELHDLQRKDEGHGKEKERIVFGDERRDADSGSPSR